MKQRYRSENSSDDLGANISPCRKQYDNFYPPSPAMSNASSYQDELQDFDASWQQQQMLSTKRSSRTLSPQGQQVAHIVSGFLYIFYGVPFHCNLVGSSACG